MPKKPTSKKSQSVTNKDIRRASNVKYLTLTDVNAIMSVLNKQESAMLANYNLVSMGQFPSELDSGYARRLYKERCERDLLDARREKLLFLFGIDLGARVNEVVGPKGLSWDSFDWDSRFVRVWDEKKDNMRICTITDDTWDYLKRFRNTLAVGYAQGLLFNIVGKTANRWLRRWAKDAGIRRPLRWHTLRHTFVVQSRRAGRDWDWLHQQTGDTVAMLIRVYSELSIEDRNLIGNQTKFLNHAPSTSNGEGVNNDRGNSSGNENGNQGTPA